MSLKKITLENFTVFEKMDIEFCDGINVFIGENGTGKTHIMKLLYAACQAANNETSFAQKIVKVFKPDDLNISRLVKRKVGTSTAKVSISSAKNLGLLNDSKTLTAAFNTKTPKWAAEVNGEKQWENQFSNLTSTFIPSKEILSNSRNLIQAMEKGNVDFDDTYKDIITSASIDISRGMDNAKKAKYLKILQNITSGKVKYENEKFYLLPGNQAKLEFQLVAEGMRKVALLWQLIKNGTLESGAVLFWDEPEANINPKHIPALVDILLSLQADGVQIFVATHDYVLAKYIEIKRAKANNAHFHSLYKKGNSVEIESSSNFKDMENNSIAEAYNKLLDEVFEQTKSQRG